jgi:hypothetical protein
VRTLLVTAGAILLALAPAQAHELKDVAPEGWIVFRDEPGGLIEAHLLRRLAFIDDPAPVALCGDLHSAATFFISIPGACSCAGARFHFHAPTRRQGQLVEVFALPTDVLEDVYPAPLRTWYLKHAAHLGPDDGYARLSARELEEMGGVLPICDLSSTQGS